MRYIGLLIFLGTTGLSAQVAQTVTSSIQLQINKFLDASAKPLEQIWLAYKIGDLSLTAELRDIYKNMNHRLLLQSFTWDGGGTYVGTEQGEFLSVIRDDAVGKCSTEKVGGGGFDAPFRFYYYRDEYGLPVDYANNTYFQLTANVLLASNTTSCKTGFSALEDATQSCLHQVVLSSARKWYGWGDTQMEPDELVVDVLNSSSPCQREYIVSTTASVHNRAVSFTNGISPLTEPQVLVRLMTQCYQQWYHNNNLDWTESLASSWNLNLLDLPGGLSGLKQNRFFQRYSRYEPRGRPWYVTAKTEGTTTAATTNQR